ncbi:MAG: cation transporter, partial [Arcobacteraceae bacterium]
MKNIKIVVYLLSALVISSANAKILEVNQLFNKSITKVKQVNMGTIKSYYGNTQINEEETTD